MNDGHWQMEGSTAELYQRYLVPAITSKWADDIVTRAHPRATETVLDVACGTGVVSRAAAKAGGVVTGLDLNAGMLAVARNVASEGKPINWVEGSALDLPFPAASFDVVFCQLGLQFFPDPGKALREMRRVTKDTGGRVAVSVYSAIERTPGAYAFVIALDEVLGPGASRIKRGEHAFAEPSQLAVMLTEAGFEAVDVHVVEQTISFPSVLDYVRFQLLATPMAILLKDRSDDERQGIIGSVAAKTTALSSPEMLRDGRFCTFQEAYVAVASPRPAW
jgi:ubiquinone/menaquinone biosynthesis C-methylase UbiE